MTPYEIRVYADASGATPFTRWLERLRDRQAVARITARLDRLGRVVLLLLCGGDKTSQQRDIERAKAYLQSYQRR